MSEQYIATILNRFREQITNTWNNNVSAWYRTVGAASNHNLTNEMSAQAAIVVVNTKMCTTPFVTALSCRPFRLLFIGDRFVCAEYVTQFNRIKDALTRIASFWVGCPALRHFINNDLATAGTNGMVDTDYELDGSILSVRADWST